MSIQRTSATADPQRNAPSRRRNHNGCFTCRLRKKACPNPPRLPCDACEHFNIECLGYGHDRPDWMKVEGTCKDARKAIKAHIGASGKVVLPLRSFDDATNAGASFAPSHPTPAESRPTSSSPLPTDYDYETSDASFSDSEEPEMQLSSPEASPPTSLMAEDSEPDNSLLADLEDLDTAVVSALLPIQVIDVSLSSTSVGLDETEMRFLGDPLRGPTLRNNS